MNHFVLIESNTTGTGAIIVERLLARGDRVTFLTRTPEKYPFLGFKDPALEVSAVNTNCFTAVIKTIQGIQARQTVNAVVTTSEFYVPLVAQVSTALGLPGLNPVAAQTCRHKPSTRKQLKAAGLLTPEFYLITGEREALELAARIEYPCVVKPPSDSSSHGVRLVANSDEFMDHYHDIHGWKENIRGQSLDGSVLVESYLEGPEYSVETVTLPCGVTHVIGVTDKHLSQEPYFVEMGHDFPSRAPKHVQQALIQAVLSALAAVNFNFGPAHTEIRWTPRGPVVIEINPRLAGGMIPELISYAKGIDLLQIWMDLLLGIPVDLTPAHENNASIRFLTADRAGQLLEVHGVDEATVIPSVREISVTAKPGKMVNSAADAYDRLGFVIGAGLDPDMVERHLQEAMQTIQLEIGPVDCVLQT
ncbi:MAG TPA: ATP-grasp domain-containing protein [Candidatus Angelobacter sp.]|nr:ATP-grasp domain-containing protein [Candidatus Angelobacter sp.]